MATKAAPGRISSQALQAEKSVLALLRENLTEARSKFAEGLREHQYEWHSEAPLQPEKNRQNFEVLKNEWFSAVKGEITARFEQLLKLRRRRKQNVLSHISELILGIAKEECELKPIFESGHYLVLCDYMPAGIEPQETTAFYNEINREVGALLERLENKHSVKSALGREEDTRRLEEIAGLYKELQNLATLARAGLRTVTQFRRLRPEFKLWEKIEPLDQALVENFFVTLGAHRGQALFDIIGPIFGLSPSTAYRKYKEHRAMTGTGRQRKPRKRLSL
jgi:hypothetical protein